MSSASTAAASSNLSLYLQKIPKQQPLKIAQIQQLKKEQQNITNLISSIQSLTIQKQAKVLGEESSVGILQVMNRSARNPKRANRGKRAVCRQARRAKRRRWGNHRRN
ncbi:predicted protein [Chaetoceros tenuissimus]|uniref:Uncharacterized protein n=1 Tax=Chaetoceros tenuissimus TaxID=426638 RepID=A0AAD3DBW5_9STRA|nr:predicted protein [Chaetoceros tenuissimus]